MRTRSPVICEQCGAPGARNRSEYGLLCDGCAYRQMERDEQRATFGHLSPFTFGFNPADDDPYD
jgi:hypothetical protein